MSKKDRRRHCRYHCGELIRLSWEDEGSIKFAQAKCVEISEGGLRLESPEPIPLRAFVTLRAERISVAGLASVRNVTRRGGKYLVGVQLRQELRAGALTPAGLSPPSAHRC